MELELHTARAEGTTHQGGRVLTVGYSGNNSSARYRLSRMSRAARGNAMLFCNYLEELTRRNQRHGGGKTAFTCAEPQAIIEALIRGATFESLCVYNIRCHGDERRPCRAFCGEYLYWDGEERCYWLDLPTIFPPPRGVYRPRRRIGAPDPNGWREVGRW
jgi:hypothetical protein